MIGSRTGRKERRQHKESRHCEEERRDNLPSPNALFRIAFNANIHVWLILSLILLIGSAAVGAEAPSPAMTSLDWQSLPDLPNELGVAGPFVGVHNDALLVAGGANFPTPVWETDKTWSRQIHVLTRTDDGDAWQEGGGLGRANAYGAAVSTLDGIVCMGGTDGKQTFQEVFVLAWDALTQTVTRTAYPDLPQPCAYGQAVVADNVIYLAGGQSDLGLDSAMNNFWTLDLSQKGDATTFVWQALTPWPGMARAFNITAAQHNGYHDCIYVMSGRYQYGSDTRFLRDVWAFTPNTGTWRRCADAPRCVMAGTGIGFGQSHIFVLGGADGSLFFKADELKDAHPGFPKEALAYHSITDTWTSAGTMPGNHVTTVPVRWRDRIVIASGEVRPRVRSASVWSVAPVAGQRGFGALNYSVLFGYLLAMVGVGVYFTKKNRNTDDYFRGGKQIPWWAAGCSIFATMLSSLTFTGIPSKAYAQDWVYSVGNMMIPVVSFVAVFVALPFYRRIDATSAYEYLEKRFSRGVRLFGSASFTLFHVFRMAVVMSLTGLALAVATPLTPMQSVLLMGVLSITYCTMGGIEAVIWTDTIQTVVLLGGALLAIALLVTGTEGGLSGAADIARNAQKFRIANFHWDVTSTQIALWVIVLGGIGQNISSYTADQAVVQRYMTTSDQRLAARSIWTNALMTIPATLIFFGIGTALFAFYHSHPDKLDATITTDQVFPLFIAREMPIGIAGLIVAGIFSAAQSTVSTSMNSTATAIVTDFLRPLGSCRTERDYLRLARVVTLLMGILGTVFGLVFVNPEIKSLFDAFLKVIGLFMGVLGGLFVLGVLTRRANAFGAMTGALVGAAAMVFLWRFTRVNGYLYTTCGIVTCVLVGYVASLLRGSQERDLTGLTLFTSRTLDQKE
jgi:solute:Na+ symporter, SSS family